MLKFIKNFKPMAHFCVPLVFICLGSFLFGILLQPIFSPIENVLSVILLDSPIQNPTDDSNVFNESIIPTEDMETIDAATVKLPLYGEQYAVLKIESCGINVPLYYGDSNDILKKGVGQYIGSLWPGFGSTVLICGHNHTFFKPLQNAKLGDIVTIGTSYGTYTYEINEIKIQNADDYSAFDLNANYENLALYTCYPFGSIGMTPTRYYVYAKYVSGPEVQYEH